MPLGYAAKMHASRGDRDHWGRIKTTEQEGWYYKWYRGLHLLCGEEGWAQYKHCPSFEDRLANTWYFDLDFPCVYQDDERGEEETEGVEDSIGAHPVDAIIPIDRSASGKRPDWGQIIYTSLQQSREYVVSDTRLY